MKSEGILAKFCAGVIVITITFIIAAIGYRVIKLILGLG